MFLHKYFLIFRLLEEQNAVQPELADVAGDVDHLLLDAAELNRFISQNKLLCVLCSETCGIVTGNDNGSVTETVVSTE